MFELRSLGLQAVVLPIEPTLLVLSLGLSNVWRQFRTYFHSHPKNPVDMAGSTEMNQLWTRQPPGEVVSRILRYLKEKRKISDFM